MRGLLQKGALLVAFKKGGQFSPAINALIPDLVLWRAFRDANFYALPGSQ